MAGDVQVAKTFVACPVLSTNEPGAPATDSWWVVGSGTWTGSPTEGQFAYWDGGSWTYQNTWTVDVPGAFDPKTCLGFLTKASAVDTLTADAILAVGGSDGTTEFSSGFDTRDAEDTTVSNLHMQALFLAHGDLPFPDNVLGIGIDGSTGSAGPGTGVWEFTYDTTPTEGDEYFAIITFFGGADYSGAVRSVEGPGTGFTVSGLSFQPNLVNAWGSGLASSSAISTQGRVWFGAAYDNGVDSDEWLCTVFNRHARNTGDPVSNMASGVFYGDSSTTGLEFSGSISTWNSDGITTTGTDGTTDHLYLLLHDIDDRSGYVALVQTPTTTGSQGYTGPGFQPQAVYGVLTAETTAPDAFSNDAEAGSWGFYAHDGGGLAGLGSTNEDGADPSNCASYAADNTLTVHEDDQSAVLYEVTGGSLDSTGWSWTFGTAPATACYIGVVAIEEPAGGVTEGDGSIASTATLTGAGTGIVVAAGAISSTATVSGSASATSEGNGAATTSTTLTGDGTGITTVDGSSAASAALSGDGQPVTEGDGSAVASALLTGDGEYTRNATGSTAAVAELSADGSTTATGTGTISAAATIAAAGSAMFEGAGAIETVSLLTADGTAVAVSSATLATIAVLTGASLTDSSGTISATSTLSGEASTTTATDGSTTASAALVGDGSAQADADGTLAGNAALAGEGQTSEGSSGAMAASATLSAAAFTTAVTDATASASATLSGAGAATAIVDGLLGAIAALSAQGATVSPADGAIAATAALSGDGAALHIRSGQMSATITLEADGQSVVVTSGISAAQASLAGDALVTALADGAMAAAATLAGATVTIVADTDPVAFFDLSMIPVVAFRDFEVAPVLEFGSLEMS